MAIAFVQALLTGQSKTAETSLSLNTATKTVTAGNDIFVAFAADDVGSDFSVSDNLGNTYALVKEQINAANVKTQLWRATIGGGGTLLDDITISWISNITAKAGVAGEFSGVGTLDGTMGLSGTGQQFSVARHEDTPWQNGDLLVGGGGWEGPGGDVLGEDSSGFTPSAEGEVGQDGTTGGGAASNIVVNLIYAIAAANSVANDALRSTNDNIRDVATAGAVYSPAAVTAIFHEPLRALQAVNRVAVW
jgi:hypothetical protein